MLAHGWNQRAPVYVFRAWWVERVGLTGFRTCNTPLRSCSNCEQLADRGHSLWCSESKMWNVAGCGGMNTNQAKVHQCSWSRVNVHRCSGTKPKSVGLGVSRSVAKQSRVPKLVLKQNCTLNSKYSRSYSILKKSELRAKLKVLHVHHIICGIPVRASDHSLD